MVKPTLLVLAAGMGSRYGSLKQMDGVGPNNEAIIDYSVYDAIRAGFGKVVFVIRHSFEKEFREVFSAERFGGRIAVEFVFQELDYLPEGVAVPEGRVKPWGTNHAVMMAADAIREPFAVINADDFYGAEAYKTIGDYLSQLGESRNSYCMVAYDLDKTLSDNGTVSRGVCGVDAAGNLTSMVERTQIERMPDGRIVFHDGGADEVLAGDTPVSMNLFGSPPISLPIPGSISRRGSPGTRRTSKPSSTSRRWSTNSSAKARPRCVCSALRRSGTASPIRRTNPRWWPRSKR